LTLKRASFNDFACLTDHDDADYHVFRADKALNTDKEVIVGEIKIFFL
jgi:hypothetical protein